MASVGRGSSFVKLRGSNTNHLWSSRCNVLYFTAADAIDACGRPSGILGCRQYLHNIVFIILFDGKIS
jgi:hypothetical protein